LSEPLIAQTEFLTTPAPKDEWSGWWPVMMITLGIVVSVVSAAWTTFMTFRGKQMDRDSEKAMRKFDAERERTARHIEIEVERMRLENDRQKEFQSDLMGQCKQLMEENQRTRDSLAKMHSHLAESHAQISEEQKKNRHQQEEIIELRAQVRMLEEKIERLEKHVAVLEGERKVPPKQVEFE
jgi:chromosome segregation ATPase